ncbi:putative amidase [Pseudomassariella vexata]|uniref:Putative amidase n=1 Tax=Pseudomassariella vexata TaxID=1141098 RepID=A0A1Y2DVV4_9PEZI|nr:putative amidase [Pseudomassariella vexata]ORY63387.1 putative amidase [Pseudomassariella vexata]
MGLTEDDVQNVAVALGYTIAKAELDDYTQLLNKARQNFEAVSAMDDYQPTPDLTLTSRANIHFPTNSTNSLNAWAWRCECTHTTPPSTTLKHKTLCLKDNIALAQIPCLLGTTSFTDWTPQIDATVVTRILEAGGTIAGKSVCENLSRGAVSVTASTGPVHNPYAHGYSAGGSSSGTGALVGVGEVDMGLGCDQGGSIRIPAAMCGVYGLKATTGLVPYTGIASLDASVDFVGPMARTVRDLAVLLEVVAGADGLDDRQGAGCPLRGEVPRYAEVLEEGKERGVKGMRIGVLREGIASPDLDEEVKRKFLAAAKEFKRLGAVVEEVSVLMHEKAKVIYTVMSKMGNHMGMQGKATGRRQLMMTDLLQKKNLPYSQDALEKMSVFSREGLLAGEMGWAEYPYVYPKAVNLSRKLRDCYDEALGKYDVLIMPTTLRPASPLPDVGADPLTHIAAGKGLTDNTSAFNASGHPALAMPIGFVPSKADPTIRLPTSMQIVGRFWEESKVLKVAYAWEKAIDWKQF